MKAYIKKRRVSKKKEKEKESINDCVFKRIHSQDEEKRKPGNTRDMWSKGQKKNQYKAGSQKPNY